MECSLSSPTLNSGLKNDRLLFYVSDVKGDLELLEWQSLELEPLDFPEYDKR